MTLKDFLSTVETGIEVAIVDENNSRLAKDLNDPVINYLKPYDVLKIDIKNNGSTPILVAKVSKPRDGIEKIGNALGTGAGKLMSKFGLK